ncbi:MAG: class I SAM-dependent methyltransferase, partial [Bacteroidota bacterium]|nr:class I SAM-dependent methyltransferase [Bacteroidota bacterium]
GRINDGDAVLEVAPGPGYLAIELAKLRRCTIVGLDISATFVSIAQHNAKDAGVNIDFRQGNVSSMPFESEKFDFIMCTSAFKNFAEPVAALNEMHRVLKPNGIAWIVDMKRNLTNETVNEYVANRMKMKSIAALYMKFIFKYFLRHRAYTKEQFKVFIAKTSFRKSDIQESAIGFELLLEK